MKKKNIYNYRKIVQKLMMLKQGALSQLPFFQIRLMQPRFQGFSL